MLNLWAWKVPVGLQTQAQALEKPAPTCWPQVQNSDQRQPPPPEVNSFSYIGEARGLPPPDIPGGSRGLAKGETVEQAASQCWTGPSCWKHMGLPAPIAPQCQRPVLLLHSVGTQ